jgi:hypothetical protein
VSHVLPFKVPHFVENFAATKVLTLDPKHQTVSTVQGDLAH